VWGVVRTVNTLLRDRTVAEREMDATETPRGVHGRLAGEQRGTIMSQRLSGHEASARS
jgi:hypothetical protein